MIVYLCWNFVVIFTKNLKKVICYFRLAFCLTGFVFDSFSSSLAPVISRSTEPSSFSGLMSCCHYRNLYTFSPPTGSTVNSAVWLPFCFKIHWIDYTHQIWGPPHFAVANFRLYRLFESSSLRRKAFQLTALELLPFPPLESQCFPNLFKDVKNTKLTWYPFAHSSWGARERQEAAHICCALSRLTPSISENLSCHSLT